MADSTSSFPGVFRGNARLASKEDLEQLRQELIYFITGLQEAGVSGYIPYKYDNDGNLDIEYLFPEIISMFKEKTGLTIYNKDIPFLSDVKTINFTGNYIYLEQDENGNLICDIRPPQKEISRFNNTNGITNGKVKITNELIENVIIPDVSSSDISYFIYGDWEPGSRQTCINWNGDIQQFLTLTTEEPILTTSNTSYFKIIVYKYGNNNDESIDLDSTFTSPNITGNTGNQPFYGKNFYIKIDNFKEEKLNEYSFIPSFLIPLKTLLPNGGRFKIKIIHYDGIYEHSYISNDLLFNVGAIPKIGGGYIGVLPNNSLMPDEMTTYNWCSGLKYISNGTLKLYATAISNLNNQAAIDDKIECYFKIAGNKEHKNSSLNNYDLSISNISNFETTLFLNENEFNNELVSGYVIAKNAFGSSTPYNFNGIILLNSITNYKISDSLNEYFTDESQRVRSNFDAYYSDGEEVVLTKWNSDKSLNEEDDGKGLMVIPTIGLTYPYGDWTNAIPPTSGTIYNYDLNSLVGQNEKYFCRIFTGNSETKSGGIFKIEGLTKEQFFNKHLSFIISPDKGENWYDLKSIRGEDYILPVSNDTSILINGVMTNIEEKDNAVYVSWAFPNTITQNTNNGLNKRLYFRVGMTYETALTDNKIIIKSISLLNVNGTKDW